MAGGFDTDVRNGGTDREAVPPLRTGELTCP
jgi:hypothetical protein